VATTSKWGLPVSGGAAVADGDRFVVKEHGSSKTLTVTALDHSELEKRMETMERALQILLERSTKWD
jgi:hypothetical protein